MEMAKKLDGATVSDSSIKEAKETGSLDYQQILDIINTSANKTFSPMSDLNDLLGYDFGKSGQTFDNGLGQFIIPQNQGRRFLSGSYNGLYSHQPGLATVSSDLLDLINEHHEGKTVFPKIEDDFNPFSGDTNTNK